MPLAWSQAEPAGGGDEVATFEFDGDSRTVLTPAQRADFKALLMRELARLRRWSAQNRWQPAPMPKLRVVVSHEFRISRSLVPAWYGRAGEMEFPARRVIAGNAAVAHELVHVLFPNANRLLAEGLAIHLQAEFGENPAFPNFGRPLHELARERLREMLPAFADGDAARLAPLSFSPLDAIATPAPLELRVGSAFYGEEPRGQACLYPLVGSFTQHLIGTRGLAAFRRLYARTPFAPLQQDAGAPARWSEVYGVTLERLEHEWKTGIACDGDTLGR